MPWWVPSYFWQDFLSVFFPPIVGFGFFVKPGKMKHPFTLEVSVPVTRVLLSAISGNYIGSCVSVVSTVDCRIVFIVIPAKAGIHNYMIPGST
jgi:hypothetical protein